MTPQFPQNYFELFGLPIAYRIDAARLDLVYRELQSQIHPDRFASASEAERRRSMQWATYANEAYQILKKPLSRARYLVNLNGVDTEEETNTAMPPAFLITQMEWRETVADAKDARDASAIDELSDKLRQERKALLVEIENALDGKHDYREAAVGVRKLRFLEKLQEEIEDALASFDDV
ncbi:MAG: Fe-S protein assembly co-chaperone HscB [Pseudomonadota bacterium]